MKSMHRIRAFILCILLATSAAGALAQKYGGTLRFPLRENPSSASLHEESSITAMQPFMAVFNNLVVYDQKVEMATPESMRPELATSWSWSDDNTVLTMKLREGVKWHDGKPFTSADVKHTFDLVRGAPDAKGKLRANPRRLWYDNVEAIETPDAATVVFRLNRPQPSLLLLLASGYSPVYPAHVPLAEFRTRCIGTGPFKLKEQKPGE